VVDEVFDLFVDVFGNFWDRFWMGDFSILWRLRCSQKYLLTNLVLCLSGEIESIVNEGICLVG
jgi:hypothetical protein